MSYIKFTIRIKPIKGETFTSFLYRATKKNKINLLELLKYVVSDKFHFTRTKNRYLLDVNPLKYIDVEKVTKLFSISKSDIYKMSYGIIVSKLIDIKEKPLSPYYSGMVTEYIDKFYYKICRTCYIQNQSISLLWRAKCYTHCSIHKENLVNVCINCMEVLEIDGLTYKELRCSSCNVELKVVNKYKIVSIKDWDFLLSDKWISKKYASLDLGRSIACLLLYVSQGEPNKYKPTRCSKGLNQCDVMKLYKMVRTKNTNLEGPSLIHLFKVLNNKELKVSINSLRKKTVNKDYINSLLDTKETFEEPILQTQEEPICKTPWCSSHTKSEDLQKIADFKHSKRFKSKYVCTKCFIKWGITNDGQIKEIEERVPLYLDVINKLNDGFSKEDLKFSEYKYSEVLGYLARYKLLPGTYFNEHAGNQKHDLNRLKNIIINMKRTNKEAIYYSTKKLYSWNWNYFFYLFYHSEIQEKLISIDLMRKMQKKDAKELLIKNLNMMIERNTIISRKNIAIFGISDSIYREFNKTIKFYKEVQKKKTLEIEKQLIWNEVKKYVNTQNQNNRKVYICAAYHKANRGARWIKNHMPELAVWLKEEKVKRKSESPNELWRVI